MMKQFLSEKTDPGGVEKRPDLLVLQWGGEGSVRRSDSINNSEREEPCQINPLSDTSFKRMRGGNVTGGGDGKNDPIF